MSLPSLVNVTSPAQRTDTQREQAPGLELLCPDTESLLLQALEFDSLCSLTEANSKYRDLVQLFSCDGAGAERLRALLQDVEYGGCQEECLNTASFVYLCNLIETEELKIKEWFIESDNTTALNEATKTMLRSQRREKRDAFYSSQRRLWFILLHLKKTKQLVALLESDAACGAPLVTFVKDAFKRKLLLTPVLKSLSFPCLMKLTHGLSIQLQPWVAASHGWLRELGYEAKNAVVAPSNKNPNKFAFINRKGLTNLFNMDEIQANYADEYANLTAYIASVLDWIGCRNEESGADQKQKSLEDAINSYIRCVTESCAAEDLEQIKELTDDVKAFLRERGMYLSNYDRTDLLTYKQHGSATPRTDVIV